MFDIHLGNIFSYLFTGITSNLATILMTFTTMSAESRLLFEYHLATVNPANIWVVFLVHVDVLHQVLPLRKLTRTNLTLEATNTFMNVHVMTFQAILWGECAIASVVEAFYALAFAILSLNHLIELIFNLIFCFLCQFHFDCILLQIWFINIIATAIFIYLNQILFLFWFNF